MNFSKLLLALLLTFILFLTIISCSNQKTKKSNNIVSIKPVKDTVGFAQYNWQMDSIIKRLDNRIDINTDENWGQLYWFWLFFSLGYPLWKNPDIWIWK